MSKFPISHHTQVFLETFGFIPFTSAAPYSLPSNLCPGHWAFAPDERAKGDAWGSHSHELRAQGRYSHAPGTGEGSPQPPHRPGDSCLNEHQ